MRIALFCHSLRSDWNHGNAHFLRGVAAALLDLGHDVVAREPADGWSATNLRREHGAAALDGWREAYPHLHVETYPSGCPDLERLVDGADLVLVHEWTEPALVARLGAMRAGGARFQLLFHDTHHRSASAPSTLAALDLDGYDGVLAFGEVVRERYLREGWHRRVWTWHEAADVRLFAPPAAPQTRSGLVWIGNWGDEERTAELGEFLLAPARALGVGGHVYGVRYPAHARRAVAEAGLRHEGWLANHRVPAVYARHAVTVHVPRRPYVEHLPGIPTIRVFEALACGIPLVVSRWHDAEGLFRPGADYLRVDTGDGMTRALHDVLHDADLARSLAASGLETISARHTCTHRAAELLAIVGSLQRPNVTEVA